MSENESNAYVLGTEREELHRLGLQHQVCLRLKALPEVIQHLESMQISSCSYDPEYMMKTYFMKINHYHNMFLEDHNYGSDNDQEQWSCMEKHILYEDDLRHLPIPVFSYIKPTMGRFILHIMLSLGEFDTELDLILYPTL